MGWIGVDLDGTLAEWHDNQDINTIGAPIPKMVERVKQWVENGIEVKIVTARVGFSLKVNPNGVEDNAEFVAEQKYLIKKWCLQVFGYFLDIVSGKDFEMVELWDDKCVRVETNTGEIVEYKRENNT